MVEEAGNTTVAERGTIVVVSRNNLHLTRKTIASAHAQDMPVDIILVDNASSDGTVQWATTKNYVSLIAFQEQRSLAACWNYALRQVFKQSSHALMLNNDVEVQPCTYTYLLQHGGPFVTCVSVDKPEQLIPPMPGSTWGERPHPDFSCFLIRKECFERMGGFREDCFPAYVEDCFAHVAMHRAGIRAVCIDLPFLHHGAGTIKHADPVERRIIEKGADENRQRFKREYGCLPGTKEYELLFS
jgi:GT2 family glycosyltransferase